MGSKLIKKNKTLVEISVVKKMSISIQIYGFFLSICVDQSIYKSTEKNIKFDKTEEVEIYK